MNTEIFIDLRLVENQKSTRAVGNVTIVTDQGDLTIQGVKVILKDGNPPWVAFPQIEWDDKVTKEKKRKKILSFSHRLEKVVTDMLMLRYQELCGNG
jgi:hypothetical protein